MVLLNKCCCCCDLRAGGITLGWLGMVIAIIQIVGGGITIHLTSDPMHPQNSIVYTFASILIGINAIFLLSNAALLWGSHKGQRMLLVPWLITVAILLAISVLAIIIVGIIFLPFLPFTGLLIYFWFCVLSLYQKLRDEEFAPMNEVCNYPFITVQTISC